MITGLLVSVLLTFIKEAQNITLSFCVVLTDAKSQSLIFQFEYSFVISIVFLSHLKLDTVNCFRVEKGSLILSQLFR